MKGIEVNDPEDIRGIREIIKYLCSLTEGRNFVATHFLYYRNDEYHVFSLYTTSKNSKCSHEYRVHYTIFSATNLTFAAVVKTEWYDMMQCVLNNYELWQTCLSLPEKRH